MRRNPRLPRLLRCHRVLVADPPWSFNDALGKRGAEANYPVLSLDDIKCFPLPAMHDDSYLLLWRVASQVEEAYEVCRAWGFVPKSEIVWVKTKRYDTTRPLTWAMQEQNLAFGMGRTVRAAHETCIVAKRGRAKPKVLNERSVFFAPRGRHSAKPHLFYAMVLRLFDGPYAELFARTPRPGWSQWGRDLPGGAPHP